LDLRKQNTYALPFSRQRIYATMMPLAFNVTLINADSVFAKLADVKYAVYEIPQEEDTEGRRNLVDQKILERCVQIELQMPNSIWFNFANVRIVFKSSDEYLCQTMEWHNLRAEAAVTLHNLDPRSESVENRAVFSIEFDYIQTPLREKRILIDQFHSLKYPENGYILKDSLFNSDYLYEWNGDSVYTNFVMLHSKLSKQGYFLEILTENFSCFDAENYGTLMLVDPEDFFSSTEVEKLRNDIENLGLSVVVMADWYNEQLLRQNHFYNNNTFEEWKPFMAGSNIRGLNQLLEPYNIAFGENVFSGEFKLNGTILQVDSSTEIIRFPKDGYLVSAELMEESSYLISKGL